MERIVLPNSIEPVFEQDFIMVLRRLSRDGGQYLVLWLALSQLPAVQLERRQLDILQERLRQSAAKDAGELYPMTNGDIFIARKISDGQKAPDIAARILASAGGPELQPQLLTAEQMHVFTMPADYGSLREKLNVYVEAVHTSVANQELTAEQLLQTENVQGPLTAWSLAQVERLFDEIDLSGYIRQQAVYKVGMDGHPHAVYHDYYLGLSNLQRARFPKLDMNEPPRLLIELRHSLDSRVLGEFLRQYDKMRGKPVFLNLSVDTALGPVFSQFCRTVRDKAERAQIGFEIHRNDWLLDLSLTKNTFELLRNEGFRTGLDAVTPDVLPFIRLDLLHSDQIKIFVERHNIQHLQNPDVLRAIRALPVERLVFARCDTEAAWQIGRALGITHFHGWYLDDMAANEKTS